MRDKFILIILVLALIFSSQAEAENVTRRYIGVVVDSNAVAYEQPDENSAVLGSLKLAGYYPFADTAYRRDEFFAPPDSWYKIVYSPTQFGYVLATQLRPQDIYLMLLTPKSDSLTILNLQFEPDTVVTASDIQKYDIREIYPRVINDTIHIFYDLSIMGSRSVYIAQGWVDQKDLNENSVRLIYNAGEHLAGRHRDIWWGDVMDQELSKQFYLMLRDYNAPFDYSILDEVGYLDPNITALERLTYVNEQLGYYDSALYYNQIIIDSFPKAKTAIGKAGAVALGEKAKIYLNYLKDYEHGVEICFEVIDQYPCEVIEGFEWNSTIDLSMVRLIADLAKDSSFNPNRSTGLLLSAYQRSTCPVVKAEAMLKRIEILRKIHQSEEALSDIIKFLYENKNVEYHFYKTDVQYAELFYDLYGLICLEDLADPARGIEFYETELEKDLTHQAALKYFENGLLDMSFGTREEVLENYHKYVQRFQWYMYNGYRGKLDRYPSDNRVKERIKQIEQFVPVTTSLKDSVVVYLSYVNDNFVIDTIPAGTQFKLLYSDKYDKRDYYKIELSDGRIGWIKMPE